MYDCILVPTDGSPEVEYALEYAFDLARTHDATVRALYVVSVAGYGNMPMEAALEGVSGALRARGNDAVDRAAQLAPADVDVETVVLEGSPSRVIVEQAQPGECDLVVMGTHGRAGLNRLLLGSVTECVVRRAPVPVLTVNVDSDEDVDQEKRRPVAVE
ncbi:universal stress protein [Natronolimnohabitans sp. A-GB9]|uniref:universal stress protein n=1 Tax=Natronolimnohabitans sp. A-GB9 TaxID=3069757 RepID=UPI0027B38323|nr:universal stress protein [Natronolimnohabitans sp. A-GB9]MDQ2049719.1 universal stress protein [Natronolimnohabitans sp. A-GB9]